MKKLFIILFISQFTFSQSDSTLFRNQFYLEFNLGSGIFNHRSNDFGIENYYSNNLSLNFISKLYYRNRRFKTGLTCGYLFVWSGFIDMLYSFEAGINILANSDFPHFFGPTMGYGSSLKKFDIPFGDRFLKFGLDYHHKNFHVGFNNQWIIFENQMFDLGHTKAINLYIELGYAFNLESFRKK